MEQKPNKPGDIKKSTNPFDDGYDIQSRGYDQGPESGPQPGTQSPGYISTYASAQSSLSQQMERPLDTDSMGKYLNIFNRKSVTVKERE
ncbi:hypothetical protein AX774_g1183 [Zancudomyces culisetae]|uniref:Uncharacterized protein n=1 Tax=Zancudomyces culisetae TaxID=1213189 RepID=A0A1R1PWD1_ZANCU|nr:hypothetical protein AX774_g1183 [Zancudomyces culisetae]|eukprot:OMH85258.1 hypothetical protein AX774_g1183 [Zancudomyces culisetae]